MLGDKDAVGCLASCVWEEHVFNNFLSHTWLFWGIFYDSPGFTPGGAWEKGAMDQTQIVYV